MISKQGRGFGPDKLTIVSALSACLLGFLLISPALALSELKPAQAPASDTQDGAEPPPLDEPHVGTDGGLPAPAPVIRSPPAAQSGDGLTKPDMSVDDASVEVITDISQLPEPVQRMRQLIIEAASSGDPEKLRALLGAGPTATQLSFGDVDPDPVDYLRSVSGDGEGQEILAILIDLLTTGLVRIDAGQPGEIYVWPYFAAVPLSSLSAPQRVELLRIVTAGDVADMENFGSYNFYRVGISPDGEWRFFMAGD